MKKSKEAIKNCVICNATIFVAGRGKGKTKYCYTCSDKESDRRDSKRYFENKLN